MKNPIFKGIGTALVTPMTPEGKIDYAAVERLVQRQLEAQIDALIVCATTGEAPTLADDEHIEMIRFVAEMAKGKTPIIAGTGSNYTDHAVEMSIKARDVGADGLLCVTPYYNKCTQRGLVESYTKIADATELPMIVYNVPGRIPTSIMTKVVSDLKQFGTVQRAILGIMGGTVTSELVEQKDLGVVDGVYVSEILPDGAAEDAGIEVGDVIVAVDGSKVKNMAQMQEMFTKHQPGDKVELTVVRNKKEKKIDVTLKNVQGNTSVVKNADLDMLGATFKELDDKDKRLYKVNYGLKVLDVAKGRFADAGIKKGFVVLKVNNTPVKSVDDMQKAVKQANSSSDQVLFIAGVTPSGKRAYFSVDLTQE